MLGVNGLSEDERLQRIADLRQKAIWDEKAAYGKGIDDGKKKKTEKLRKIDNMNFSKTIAFM